MEPNQNAQNNFLTIPLAIVVAGIVIAGAIFFGGRGGGMTTNNQPTTDTQPAAVAVALRQVSASDHIRGNPDAKITLVEYSDTECPFCKAFQSTMQKLMEEYGKDGSLAWVYRHFPLDQLHPVKARKEAEATECAGELGGNIAFWSYLDRIFEITPSNNGLDLAELPKIAALLKLDEKKFNECVTSGKYAEKIEKDYQDGVSAGATGTPFSVLVLKKAVTKTQEAALAPLIAQFRGGVALSSDKTKMTINGALPYNAVKMILDVILK
ncbi:MAG: DsbA family protein [bacterium]|nr:DsbA family protein [bacterium]